ncbi:hypothetical protein Kpol_1036p61 [Vanderwaltozyma polyspora DSM 70294]|uniref:Pre-mRNA-splicing factor CLF1 n=1 Tax=Vanderwaltozyma polyspora (strain ATCC 22028 / DSM 70294 / BCRC 21397 / CBS 2163 / NBRC 10782 / NRRL Y-8283 / UCD 57-17) TaxID=436907 RepID=A7TEK9_VANPO|nr:uncharacterized protein Kpol_1036p61 [Vanderwaltozyma polyspora DSM 70294]EDO19316.1 hypothetical protein Kpol_1036p61 [Vanderwaltozyma polyspora DSM 70294]
MSDTNGQITSDQLFKEALEKKKQSKLITKVDVLDLEELKDLQRRKRSEYEGYLKRNRLDMGQWIRYAQFEVDQHDLKRARSIFERALLVDNSHVPLWIRYIDTELKNKYINHARNLLNLAINTLPRVDKFWYKYLLVEESLGNTDIVRSLYIKWISLEPLPNAWNSFIDFEIRQNNFDGVRETFLRYVLVHPSSDTWFRWIDFELTYGDVPKIRKVYSTAIDTLVSYSDSSSDFINESIKILIAFANWESTQEEYERAKALFQLGSQKWPENTEIRDATIKFEKTFGDSATLDNNIILRRKTKYEAELNLNPKNYDNWWIYLDLLEAYYSTEYLTKLESAVTDNTPDDKVKSLEWERYIYLWIRCLTHLELKSSDISNCRRLYNKLIKEIIPHKLFSFSEVWILYANFEIRQDEITSARKILGMALGMCPDEKIFQRYIDIEIKLREFDRVRKIYEKYVLFSPDHIKPWTDYAQLESNLGDEERARGIFKIALSDSIKCLSEASKILLFKSFITFETDSENYGGARNVYESLLEFTNYATQVWIDFAYFEASAPTEAQLEQINRQDSSTEDGDSEDEFEFEPSKENFDRARAVFERGIEHFKNIGDTQSRINMLESLQVFENSYGDVTTQKSALGRLPEPKRSKKFKDGIEIEYIDYIFPDDVSAEPKPNISKILDLAKSWEVEQRG